MVEAFKIWHHYLEGCKHKNHIFMDYNNLCSFIDRKNLSSRQVCLAQELCQYHFWIKYDQDKVNGAVNTLFKQISLI